MPFQCAICEEESNQICVYCTKDTCGNHICEKCLRCSDCCGCEVPLEEYREPAVEAVLAQAAGAETSLGAADTSVCATPEASSESSDEGVAASDGGGAVAENTGTGSDGSVGGAETLFGAEAAAEPAGVPAEDVAGQAADKDLSSPGHV